MQRKSLLILVFALLAGCSSGRDESLTTQVVTLPDGAKITAEIKATPEEKARGMMYRESNPVDRGMLFLNPIPAKEPYWMGNCHFPLDIIWMDENHRVQEISANTPPCPAANASCASYGGHYLASYVLEVNGGEGAKHGVVVGATINF